MPAVNIVESRKSVQYTGSNSAEIDSLITDLTIDSEVGGVLTVTSSGNQYVVGTGSWINYWQGYISGVYTNSQFNFFFLANAVTSDVSAIPTMQSNISTLQTQMSAINVQAVRSAGVQTAPTLLLGIAQNVDVTLLPPMPNTSFTPYAYAFGAVNLSGLTINSVTVLNASTVRVNVQTSLASLGGAHIMAIVKS